MTNALIIVRRSERIAAALSTARQRLTFKEIYSIDLPKYDKQLLAAWGITGKEKAQA
jgi:hypothetical protein